MILKKESINQHYNIPKVKESLTRLNLGLWKLSNCPNEYARGLNENFENAIFTKTTGKGERKGIPNENCCYTLYFFIKLPLLDVNV